MVGPDLNNRALLEELPVIKPLGHSTRPPLNAAAISPSKSSVNRSAVGASTRSIWRVGWSATMGPSKAAETLVESPILSGISFLFRKSSADLQASSAADNI